MPIEIFEKMIKEHGADRILFGSDLPWTNPKVGLERVNLLNISNAEKEMILGKNAEMLLSI